MKHAMNKGVQPISNEKITGWCSSVSSNELDDKHPRQY